MNARIEALEKISKRARVLPKSTKIKHSSEFCARVFHRGLIQQLPNDIANNWLDTMERRARFDPKNADAIAKALKNWAIELGATRFTQWFQPFTKVSSELEDSFLGWGSFGADVEKLCGQDLIRGNPNVSCFPSGSATGNDEERGYTLWDPTSYPFLWEGQGSLTLCIPALFFSYKEEAFDHKVPLLRSEEKLNDVIQKLSKLCQGKVGQVFSTLGLKQEYFLIDRSLCSLRPDLVLYGRTLFGAPLLKGKELENQYSGSVKDRVIAFMYELEDLALSLGIPIKARPNENSPGQYEVLFPFERVSLSVDHNIMLMQLMRQIAVKYDLSCIFHEKPFQQINSSVKYLNWSLITDEGKNLFNPKKNTLIFITLLTAFLKAISEDAGLLRASVGKYGNERRLEEVESSLRNFSVYLGNDLEEIIDGIIETRKGTIDLKTLDLKFETISRYTFDVSEEKRYTAFTFTGNQFEFCGVEASASSALLTSVIHTLLADSLELIVNEICDVVKDEKLSGPSLFQAALPVLKKHLRASRPVIFSRNKRSEEEENKGFGSIKRSDHSFYPFLDKKAIRAFEGILSEDDLKSRNEVLIQHYVRTINNELNLMFELFQTQILPAAQKDFTQRNMKVPYLDEAIELIHELKTLHEQSSDMGWEARAKVYSELLTPKMDEFRLAVDQLELLVDNVLWPLPKYRELLLR